MLGVMLFAGTVQAMSSDQMETYDQGIYYFDVNPATCSSGTTSATPSFALPSNASPDAKIGQTFIVGFDAGTNKSVIRDLFTKYKLGGMYLTGTNDAAAAGFDKSFYAGLTQAAGVPITAASDEEGVVHRYTYPGNIAIPAAQMGDNAESIGKQMGQYMKANGLTTDLAPVLDLRDVGNGLAGRSFSNDPAVVTKQAGAFTNGLLASGITPVFKHFPGFDSSTNGTTDDVNGQPSIIHMKGSIDSVVTPYKSLVTQYPDAAVMLSNMYIDSLDANNPASTSPKVIDYLRNTVHFNGVITTDDLAVGAVTSASGGTVAGAVAQSLQAGVTMPLFQAQDTTNTASAEAAMQRIIDKVKQTVDANKITTLDSQVAAFKNKGGASGSTDGSTPTCCSGGSTQLTGNTNRAKIFNYLTGKGLSNAQAAGIMGNMQTESGFEPQRLENVFDHTVPADKAYPTNPPQNPTVDKTGWGLVQWTPYTKMIGPTESAGKDPNDMGVQLDFLWGQLYGKQGDLGQTSAETFAGSDLKKQTTPESAANSFGQYYERFGVPPGSTPSTDPNFIQRASQARSIYVTASTGAPLPPNATTPTSSDSSCGGGGSTDISAYKNPYRDLKDIQPDRIDGGLDINGDGPIHPLGNAKIILVLRGPDDIDHWYTTYIEYQLTDGPAQGKYVYFAEHCTPAANLQAGKTTVTSDDVLCTMPKDGSSTMGGPGAFSESGWGNASYATSSYVDGSDYHLHSGSDNGNWASNGGVNFNALIKKLNGPQGRVVDGPSTAPLPGFPDWK